MISVWGVGRLAGGRVNPLFGDLISGLEGFCIFLVPQTFTALGWLARLVTHVPSKGDQLARYYGYRL